MEKLRGRLRKGQTKWVSANWGRILLAHREEVPDLQDFVPGSFNIDLTGPPIWRPPNEGFFYARSRAKGLRLREAPPAEGADAVGSDFLACGNFIHPQIRVVSVNRRQIDGRLYFAGIAEEEWQKRTVPWPLSRSYAGIEIIAKSRIRPLLGLGPDDFGNEVEVELSIEHA